MKRAPLFQRFVNWRCLLIVLLLPAMASAQTYSQRLPGTWWGAIWSTQGCNGMSAFTYPTESTHDVNMTCGNYNLSVNTLDSVGGALTKAGGTLTIEAGRTLTVTSFDMTGGDLVVNGTLIVTGDFRATGGTVTGTGTIKLLGAEQNITIESTLPNLEIGGTGNKTMLSDVDVLGNLHLAANNLIV